MKLSIVTFSFLSFIMFLSDSNKRKYDDGEFAYEFHIAENNSKVKLKKNVRFYWYNYSEIESSIYGVSGKVLNGKYEKKYLSSNELIEKGSFVYGLKNGEWKKWDKGGILRKVEFWKEGYKEGVFEFYDEKSNLIISGNYKKGKKSGQWKEYKDQSLIMKTWLKGKLNGRYKEFKDDTLIKSGKYNNGLKHGLWIDKEKKSRKKYKKGKLINENAEKFWDRFSKKK